MIGTDRVGPSTIFLSSIQRKLFPLLVKTTPNSNMKTLELDP